MDFRVTLYRDRTINTKQGTEKVTDKFITFVYGLKLKNVRQAKSAIRTVLAGRLDELKRQGLRITKPQVETFKFDIERV